MAVVDDEYGDEYYEEEEEEEEVVPIKPAVSKQAAVQDKHETQSSDSMQKIKRIVESQNKIPRIIIIKDQFGVEQEYEVLEESEEEENSVALSISGLDGLERSIRVTNKGASSKENLSSRRRIQIEGQGFDDESFYIEEIIEESEEESDE